MRILFLLTVFKSIATSSFAQTNWENVSVYNVGEPRFYHTTFETQAHIDSTLWRNFLNWNLKLDSVRKTTIPKEIYKIPVQFIVDSAGKIIQVKVFENSFGLGELVQRTIVAFPYKWSPATQNGRPVKSYHKRIISFDLRKTSTPN